MKWRGVRLLQRLEMSRLQLKKTKTKVKRSQMKTEIKTHQSHETGSDPDQRTCCHNDKCQLPSFHKANAEATNKSGEALQEDGNLIGDGIVDLVNVTAMKITTL